MPRTVEDIEKSKQFLTLLQEFAAARKRAKEVEDERLKKEAEEAAREAQEKLNKSGKKLDADDLAGLNNPRAVTDAVNRANELAHANYRQETDANNALYDKAQVEYRKTTDECNAEITKASQAHRDSGSPEDYERYIKIKAEQEERINKAYNKLNEELDACNKANAKAHEAYMRQVNANHAELDKYVAARAAADEQAKRGLQDAPTPKATVVSDHFKKVLEDYNKKFQDDPWYKANPPHEKDGKLNMSFKSNQDMTSFFREQAAKNQNFTLVDGATNKVMAYSKDGKFYHSNHSEVKDGDVFTPGDKTIDQFRVPGPTAKAGKDNEPPLSHAHDTESAQRMADSIRSTASQLSSPRPTPGEERREEAEERREDDMTLR